VNVGFDALARDQFVENGQYLLAVVVGALQPGLDGEFIAMALEKLVEELAGDVDIAAEGVGGVAAQEEPVEHRGLALGSQRVEVVQYRTGCRLPGRMTPGDHGLIHKNEV